MHSTSTISRSRPVTCSGMRQRVRDDCRRRFPVVMVDEFQDTNPLQKELLEFLCGEEQRLFIVGDPKQSIYLFRGADVSVFGRTQAETARRGGREPLLPGIVPFPGGDHRVRQPAVQRGNGDRRDREISPFEVRYEEGDHLQPQRLDWDGIPCVELLTVAGDGREQRKTE